MAQQIIQLETVFVDKHRN